MNLARTVAPAVDVITLADLKAALRITHSDHDTELTGYRDGAVERLEGRYGLLGRSLITQTWTLSMDCFPVTSCDMIRLPFPPVQSITSVTYKDSAGDAQTFDAANYEKFERDDEAFLRLVTGASWPVTDETAQNAVVTYVAGYGDAATDVLPDIRNAIIAMVRHLYDEKAALSDMDVLAMVDRYRVVPYAL